MQTSQAKSHNSDKEAAKTAEPTPKAASTAPSATRVPVWANSWEDHSPSLMIQRAPSDGGASSIPATDATFVTWVQIE